MHAYSAIVRQELIRRWDSERELFKDDFAHVLKDTEKKSTSFNKLDNSCTVSPEFINRLLNFNLAVIEYLYRGRRAVPLQDTYTTRHSNSKLSIVMPFRRSRSFKVTDFGTNRKLRLILTYMLSPKRNIWLPLLRLTTPLPTEWQWMAKTDRQTDRQTDDRRTDDSI